MKINGLLIVALVALAVSLATLIIAAEPKEEATKESTDFEYVEERLEQAAARLEAEKQRDTAAKIETTMYLLTEEETALVCEIVYAEAGNQGFYGQVLVAQCIRNACEIDGIRPAEAIEIFQYAKPKANPPEEVKKAVTAVFDENYKITELPILYFYSTAGGFVSNWHETQDYVLTHKDHKFFCRKID